MKSQTLHIADRLNNDSALAITHTLRLVDGVRGVICTAGNSRLQVDFDEDLTSPQEIETVLERAGYRVRSVVGAHASGSCCGSCGG